MVATTAAQKASLQRVRDNQRRSRARRKEYLAALEEKYRHCELLGVEASAEIQAAARKVAEENKRLRALLRTQGLADHDIDAASSPAGSREMSTAPLLDTLLSTRKSCCIDKKPTVTNVVSSRQSPISSPAGYGVLPVASSPINLQPMPKPSMPTIPMSNYSAPSIQTRPLMEPDHLQNLSHLDFSPQDVTAWTMNVPNLDDAFSVNYATSSCNFAASIMTNMNHAVSASQIMSELNCAPTVDCKINDSTLFGMMDKYSGDQNWMETM